MIKASVSDIHLCHRCPRLLAYKLSGESSAWKVGLTGTGFFNSTLFHEKIAKAFHYQMATNEPNPIKNGLTGLMAGPLEDFNNRLFDFLRINLLEPLLCKEASKLTEDRIMALARGLMAWSGYLGDFLSENLDRRPKQKPSDWSELFRDPEQKVSAFFSLADGLGMEVTGAYDTVLFDLVAKEAIVVEFKGLKPVHEDEDLVQVALYAWLIRQATGISPRSVVLYLEAEELTAKYSAAQLAGLEPQLISLCRAVVEILQAKNKKGKSKLPPPHNPGLCQVCTFDPNCDHDWGPRQETKLIPTDTTEANGLMVHLVKTLADFKMPVAPEGYILGPRLIRLKVRPKIEEGTTVAKIFGKAADLQIALSLKTPPLILAQAGHLSLDVPRKVTTPLTLIELWDKGQGSRPDSEAAFPLGMAVDGAVVWADLTEPTMTSILVAGTSGSGKSIFLRSAVLGLALNSGPDRVKFTLIDPKWVTFTDLAKLPYLNSPLIMELDPALEALSSLVNEMDERYKLFALRAVPDIEGYNRLSEKPLAHHVVIIDEYADLMIDKNFKADTELLIQRLGQKGRAAGFHLILSTQRPDAKVVTPLIKANLQLKVALKVTTTANSQIILDEPGAERLMGHGDMLVGGAIPLIRLQGAIPTKTEIEAAFNRK